MSTRERRERERMARREAILDAAEAVLGGAPSAEPSMAQVARRAELGKATLYYYFPTKEALRAAVIERGMQRLFEQVLGGLRAGGSFADGVSVLLGRYVDFFLEHRALLALVFPLALRGAGHPSGGALFAEEPVLRQMVEAHRPVLAALHERAAAERRPVAPDRILRLVMDLALGFGARILAGGDDRLHEDVAAFASLVRSASSSSRKEA